MSTPHNKVVLDKRKHYTSTSQISLGAELAENKKEKAKRYCKKGNINDKAER